MQHHRRTSPSGFTLIELLLVIAIVALLIGILLPALGEARRAARTAICLSNMKQMATATQSYASDFQDRIFNFTWAKGHMESQWQDLQNPPDNLSSIMFQVIDTWRRRADRTDIMPIWNWVPTVYYTHVVLQDYLAQRLPEPMVACPEDVHRLNWQFDARNNHDKGAWQPFQNPSAGGVGNNDKRWVFSSSYRPVSAAYDRSPPHLRMAMISHMFVSIPNRAQWLVGETRLSSVVFPAQKVHMHDQESRHFGRQNFYYAIKHARQPLQMFDGSVNIRLTMDSNEGQHPNNITSPTARMIYTYGVPRPWEAPTSQGLMNSSEPVIGHYSWTRGGLGGVDFGSDEAPTR